jgi:protein-tyrosine phosphatase
VVLACGALVGVWQAERVAFGHTFEVIDEGKVYQSGAMPPDEFVAVVARYGVRTVVDLRKPGQGVQAERAALAGRDVRHVHLPAKQVPDAETVEAFLRLTDDPAAFPLLIHCKHGSGRSSLFAAIYRIEHLGWDNDRARRATRLFPDWSSFGRDVSKGRYLLEYRPRRALAADVR